MTEAERIRDQLKRAMEGDTWCGLSMLEALKGVSAEQASAQPIAGVHSIWEIVRHVIVWIEEPLSGLSGVLNEIPREVNWSKPPADSDEASWLADIEKLREAHGKLMKALDDSIESRLDEPVVEGLPSVYVILHGVVQHILYHAAQIAVLKKATR